jgi:hypothetical protein
MREPRRQHRRDGSRDIGVSGHARQRLRELVEADALQSLADALIISQLNAPADKLAAFVERVRAAAIIDRRRPGNGGSHAMRRAALLANIERLSAVRPLR